MVKTGEKRRKKIKTGLCREHTNWKKHCQNAERLAAVDWLQVYWTGVVYQIPFKQFVATVFVGN
jgi:hypothetical protein